MASPTSPRSLLDYSLRLERAESRPDVGDMSVRLEPARDRMHSSAIYQADNGRWYRLTLRHSATKQRVGLTNNSWNEQIDRVEDICAQIFTQRSPKKVTINATTGEVAADTLRKTDQFARTVFSHSENIFRTAREGSLDTRYQYKAPYDPHLYYSAGQQLSPTELERFQREEKIFEPEQQHLPRSSELRGFHAQSPAGLQRPRPRRFPKGPSTPSISEDSSDSERSLPPSPGPGLTSAPARASTPASSRPQPRRNQQDSTRSPVQSRTRSPGQEPAALASAQEMRAADSPQPRQDRNSPAAQPERPDSASREAAAARALDEARPDHFHQDFLRRLKAPGLMRVQDAAVFGRHLERKYFEIAQRGEIQEPHFHEIETQYSAWKTRQRELPRGTDFISYITRTLPDRRQNGLDFIIYPTGNHFVIFIVDHANQSLEYYDPKGISDREVYRERGDRLGRTREAINQNMLSEMYLRIFDKAPADGKISMIAEDSENSPQRHDEYNCLPMCVNFAEKRITGMSYRNAYLDHRRIAIQGRDRAVATWQQIRYDYAREVERAPQADIDNPF